MASRSGAPLMATMRSPARRPARAAALRGRTEATRTPSTWLGAQLVMLGGQRVLEWVGRRVELLEALDEVLQPRADGEEGHDPGRPPRESGQDLEVVGEHGRDHGGDLAEGGGLPEPARRRMHGPPRHVDDDHAHAQDQIAPDAEG